MRTDSARGRAAAAVMLAVAVLLPAGPSHGQVQISPAYVETPLEKGRAAAGRFLVSNLGTEPVRYRVNALFYKYTLDGALVQIPTGDRSLAGWILFNPKELTLAPGTQRAVRYAIVPKGDLLAGEYWAAMELESLKRQEVTTKDANGGAVTLQFIATIQVPIFGTVGKVTYQGELPDVRLLPHQGSPYIVATVGNTGSGRLGARGSYKILDASRDLVEQGELTAAYVLPSSQRRLITKVKADLREGRYTIQVRYQSLHLARPLEREVQVDWRPPPKSTTAPTKPVPATQPVTQPVPTTRTQPTTTAVTQPVPTTQTRPVTQPVPTTGTQPATPIPAQPASPLRSHPSPRSPTRPATVGRG